MDTPKEVNDPGGSGWDLRETLKKGGRRQTWDNVTRWLMGIRKLPTSLDWKQIEEVEEADRVSELASIVAMNVKKSPGGAVADGGSVREAAHHDSELLEQQLSLYDPDLIIGCGKDVTRALRREIQTIKSASWQSTTRGVRFLRLASGAVYIDFCHPSARVSPNIVCYSLIDAVREIDAG